MSLGSQSGILDTQTIVTCIYSHSGSCETVGGFVGQAHGLLGSPVDVLRLELLLTALCCPSLTDAASWCLRGSFCFMPLSGSVTSSTLRMLTRPVSHWRGPVCSLFLFTSFPLRVSSTLQFSFLYIPFIPSKDVQV